MTDTDRIAQMAREAGMVYASRMQEFSTPLADGVHIDELARFARLVAEDCAMVAYQKVAEGNAHYAHVAIRDRYSKEPT